MGFAQSTRLFTCPTSRTNADGEGLARATFPGPDRCVHGTLCPGNEQGHCQVSGDSCPTSQNVGGFGLSRSVLLPHQATPWSRRFEPNGAE